MQLRDHPLMSRNGVPSWPPVWVCCRGAEDKTPQGEVGILKWVALTGIQPPGRCYLYIDNEESSYMGCLLFDDDRFCRQVAKLLERFCNRSIAEIGSINCDGTFNPPTGRFFELGCQKFQPGIEFAPPCTPYSVRFKYDKHVRRRIPELV
jgi:hypothetical protein